MPRASVFHRAWSAKSHTKPPWKLGYFSARSQYSCAPPLELPIAWVYSQRTSGLDGLFSTYFLQSHGLMYIGQNTSVPSPFPARSY